VLTRYSRGTAGTRAVLSAVSTLRWPRTAGARLPARNAVGGHTHARPGGYSRVLRAPSRVALPRARAWMCARASTPVGDVPPSTDRARPMRTALCVLYVWSVGHRHRIGCGTALSAEAAAAHPSRVQARTSARSENHRSFGGSAFVRRGRGRSNAAMGNERRMRARSAWLSGERPLCRQRPGRSCAYERHGVL
jgi:hypothetical protein